VKTPVFLTLAEAVEIHKNQIELYGGEYGVRDIGLLESAIAQPEASFTGEWLHSDIYEMASAYAFHMAMNRPFIDGNKRTALASALIFLEINGVSIADPEGLLLAAMLKLAQGDLSKKEFSDVLRRLPSK
jgi:death-on-curing protein